MSEGSCITFWYDLDRPTWPPNCPGCGRFLKWDPEKRIYTCVCDGIIVLRGSGEPDVDEDFEEDQQPFRICRKPEGWKEDWGEVVE